jgi:trans-2-enoyl-CoA reductase
MNKIDEIVNDIYDPEIEKPEKQALMASCIKAWLRDAIGRGVILGKEELSEELEVTIKKNMNPRSKIWIINPKGV